MYQENELDQIRLRKIQAMLDAAKKGQTQVTKQSIILTDSNFSAAVSSNELLVVDFWAPWCSPCRMVGPIIEQLATDYAGKVGFGKMNVDENQKVPRSFGIMSIYLRLSFFIAVELSRLLLALILRRISNRYSNAIWGINSYFRLSDRYVNG